MMPPPTRLPAIDSHHSSRTRPRSTAAAASHFRGHPRIDLLDGAVAPFHASRGKALRLLVNFSAERMHPASQRLAGIGNGSIAIVHHISP